MVLKEKFFWEPHWQWLKNWPKNGQLDMKSETHNLQLEKVIPRQILHKAKTFLRMHLLQLLTEKLFWKSVTEKSHFVVSFTLVKKLKIDTLSFIYLKSINGPLKNIFYKAILGPFLFYFHFRLM